MEIRLEPNELSALRYMLPYKPAANPPVVIDLRLRVVRLRATARTLYEAVMTGDRDYAELPYTACGEEEYTIKAKGRRLYASSASETIRLLANLPPGEPVEVIYSFVTGEQVVFISRLVPGLYATADVCDVEHTCRFAGTAAEAIEAIEHDRRDDCRQDDDGEFDIRPEAYQLDADEAYRTMRDGRKAILAIAEGQEVLVVRR